MDKVDCRGVIMIVSSADSNLPPTPPNQPSRRTPSVQTISSFANLHAMIPELET
jgi:hypothetical protein